jgi:hypothetical protein
MVEFEILNFWKYQTFILCEFSFRNSYDETRIPPRTVIQTKKYLLGRFIVCNIGFQVIVERGGCV